MDQSEESMQYVGSDEKGFDPLRLNQGTCIEDWPEGITFFVRYRRAEDYVIPGLHWDLFSERARQVFESCRVPGVQFLPLRLLDREQPVEVGPYWALNVLKEVDGLGWGRTRWAYPERIDECDPLLNIVKPALRWDVVKGIDIFRLNVKGGHMESSFISNRLKRCLEGAGATTGVVFLGFAAC